MKRIVSQGVLVAVLCAGCASAEKEPRYPDDPLLLSKKPVEGKHDPTRTDMLARVEPLAPPLPTSLLAAKPKASPPLTTAPSPTPKTSPVSTPPSAVIRATPALRRRVTGTFGNAADFSWLQGILESTPAGALQLRYVAPDAADSQAGVVHLEEDARLNAFRPGDVIMLEGELSGAARYRAHSVWLVKRGE